MDTSIGTTSIMESTEVAREKNMADLFNQLGVMQVAKENARIEKVETLYEAIELAEQTNETEILNKIVQLVEEKRIYGDVVDYHNLAVTFSRKNKDMQAVAICKAGLENWPENVDLNADLIKYAVEAGQGKCVEEYVDNFINNCPDKRQWNWRGFSFLIDYYEAVKPSKYAEKIKELLTEYKSNLPYEEKAYEEEASFYMSQGMCVEAVDTLEYAIAHLCAPQCAMKLADIYMGQGKYQEVVRVASLGIAYSAEVQPSIRTAYLLMLRALSKDALYLKEAYTSGIYSVDEAKRTIREYELAGKYVNLRERNTIELRIAILKAYAGLDEE